MLRDVLVLGQTNFENCKQTKTVILLLRRLGNHRQSNETTEDFCDPSTHETQEQP